MSKNQTIKNLAEYWRKLGPAGQIILVVLVALAVWYFKKRLTAVKDVKERQIEQKAELQVYEEQGIMPSYTQKTYQDAAALLFKAMAGPGTDEETLYKIFTRMKNDRDIMELERAFGLRKSPWSASPFTSPTDLKDWIQSDLSSEDLQQLNAQLSRQGITKRF